MTGQPSCWFLWGCGFQWGFPKREDCVHSSPSLWSLFPVCFLIKISEDSHPTVPPASSRRDHIWADEKVEHSPESPLVISTCPLKEAYRAATSVSVCLVLWGSFCPEFHLRWCTCHSTLSACVQQQIASMSNYLKLQRHSGCVYLHLLTLYWGNDGILEQWKRLQVHKGMCCCGSLTRRRFQFKSKAERTQDRTEQDKRVQWRREEEWRKLSFCLYICTRCCKVLIYLLS